MSTVNDAQLNDFQARLGRIGSGKTHLADGLVDREMIEAARAGKTTSKSANARVTPKLKMPGKSVVITFFIGLIAVLVGRVIAFHYSGVTVSGFDLPGKVVSAMGSYGLTAAILFVIMVGLGLRDKPHVIGITIGCIAMYFAEPFMASQAPETWSKMYSADHVDGMLTSAGLRGPMAVGLPGLNTANGDLPKVTTPKYQYGGIVSKPSVGTGQTVPGSAATLPEGVPELKIPRLNN